VLTLCSDLVDRNASDKATTTHGIGDDAAVAEMGYGLRRELISAHSLLRLVDRNASVEATTTHGTGDDAAVAEMTLLART